MLYRDHISVSNNEVQVRGNNTHEHDDNDGILMVSYNENYLTKASK